MKNNVITILAIILLTGAMLCLILLPRSSRLPTLSAEQTFQLEVQKQLSNKSTEAINLAKQGEYFKAANICIQVAEAKKCFLDGDIGRHYKGGPVIEEYIAVSLLKRANKEDLYLPYLNALYPNHDFERSKAPSTSTSSPFLNPE